METAYDWLTLALFAGIVVLFLQRSSMESPPDRMIDYLPPALGCLAANWLGNTGIKNDNLLLHGGAVAIIVGVMVYVWLVLKPKLK